MGTGAKSSRAYPDRPSQRLADDDATLAGLPEIVDLAETVTAAREGQSLAWSALFDRFYDDVFRYALARLGEAATAEDVAQEVFVAAVRSLHRLRDTREPAVQAWFFRICRNKIADHGRRFRRSGTLSTAGQVGPELDPEAEIERASDATAIRAALDELTESQRDVIIRRFILDQSLEHVAAGTGRSVGSVKSLQHRALSRLQRRIQRELP